MDYIITCMDCGHPVLHTGETEEKNAVCPKCGFRMIYLAAGNQIAIRRKSYSSMLLFDRDRMLKIGCPECGRLIASSAEGTRTDTMCPKCKTRLEYRIENGTVCLQKK